MSVVTVYSAPECHLCAEAMAALRRLQPELGFALQERDITADDVLHRTYLERVPVVALDGEELFDFFVDEGALRAHLDRVKSR